MTDRLQEILRREDLTAAKFASVLGVQPSAISHLLSGRNKPGYDFICRFMMAYPKYNIEWLLIGKQPMLKENIKPAATTVTLADPDIEKAATITTPENSNKEKDKTVSAVPVQPINREPSTPKIEAISASPRKVIVLYEDSTFESYDHR